MSNDTSTELNILDIMKWLPHRYPLLLVDKVISHDGVKHIKALKNVTMNEEFFTGHFPQFPVMPGVLMIEAMAQVSGILYGLVYGMQKENEQSFFASIDKARFKRQVIPGDQLIFDIELLKVTRGIAKFQAVATVEGQVAAEAEIMIARREV